MATFNVNTGDLLTRRLNGMLNVNATTIFNAVQGGSPLSILTSVLSPAYRILFADTSEEAITVGGVAAIQPIKSASISTAPIAANNGETGGAYSSFNKVMTPGRLTVRLIVDGFTGVSGAIPSVSRFSLTTQSDVLDTIDKMIAQTYLYDIETPKETFSGYDLIGKDYAVTAKNGVTMLVVNLFFQEVIRATEVILSSQNTNNKPANNGTSQASSAVTKQVQSATRPVPTDTLTRITEGIKSSVSFVGDSIDNIKSGFISGMKTAGSSPEVVSPEATRKVTQSIQIVSRGLA